MYKLRFEVKQFSYANDDVAQAKIETLYDIIDDIVFSIVPDVVDSLQVTLHPSTISAELRSSDASVLLVPQPEVSFTDKFGNPTTAAILGVVVSHLCYSDQDSGADSVPGLCLCEDTSCWNLPTVEESQEKAESFLDGNVIASFSGNAAAFTDLAVQVARTDLRLVIHMFQGGLAAAPFAFSNVFGIAPGDVDSLLVVDDPSLHQGCARCPLGVHFVGAAMPARVKIYDALGNLITTPGAQEIINMTLYLLAGGQFVEQTDNLVGPPAGQIRAQSRVGVAEFFLLRMSRTGDLFRLEFGLESKWWIRNFLGNFSIVNGRPEKLRTLGGEFLYSADQEVLVRQPALEILDVFDNRIVSDCYTSCGSTTCNAFDTACPEVVTAHLEAGPAMLGGRKTAEFHQGVAQFTDLFIDSTDPNCWRGMLKTFTLHFSVENTQDGAPMTNSTASLSAIVQRRVQSLFILVYPTRVVARERFQVAPQVLARDCTGEEVENATAPVRVSIKDDAGGGVLSGTKLVTLLDGSASFGTISIDLFGDGYTLQFDYLGNAVVESVASTPFSVERSSARLIVLQDAEGRNLNGTVTEANKTFVVQPVVGIYDAANNLVDLSTAQVTASIFKNPGNLQAHDPGQAVLLGTTTVSAKRGVVTFTDLRIAKANTAQFLQPPQKYTLLFALQEVTVESEEFDIKPALEMRNLIVFESPHQAPTPDIAGNILAINPLVLLTDHFKNRLEKATISKEYFIDILLERQSGPSWVSAGNGTLISDRCVILEDNTRTPGVQCEGVEPVRCFNFGDCAGAKSKNAELTGTAFWTDLRIDIAGTYRFSFTYTDPDEVEPDAAVSSPAFSVLNSLPSYAFVEDQIEPVNVADRILHVQPKVTVKDVYGNKVVVDDIENRYISVELLTEDDELPTQPPDPPAKGQAPNSVCRLSPVLLEGNTSIPVDLSTGEGTFTDLAVRQAMSNYRFRFTMPTSTGIKIQTSISFRVEAGYAVGLCNMSLPSLCQSKSPCLTGGTIVCMDSYGNVQTSCLAFFYGTFTGSPFTIPDAAHVDCRGTVCVRLIEASPGAVLSSQSLNGNLDCATTFCQASVSTGFAAFSDLSISLPGTTFVLEFRAYVWNDYIQSAYEWTYVTPAFNVTPVSPSIIDVSFNGLMNQVFVQFDRVTNMNNWATEGRDSTCTNEMDRSTVVSLGAGPYCTWISEETFVMSLGANAYINESTTILLNPASDITFSEVVYGALMTSLPGITIKGRIIGGVTLQDIFPKLPATLPKPMVVMTGPESITSCDLLNINAARSSGYAGRQFEKIKFAVDLANSKLSSPDQDFLSSGEAAEPVFSKRRIHFGEQVPGLDTTVTVTIRPETAIFPGANMTITGLPEYRPAPNCDANAALRTFQCPQGTCFTSPLSGPDAHKFTGPAGSWTSNPVLVWVVDAAPPQAILQVRDAPGNMLSDIEDTVISFRITNPSSAVNRQPVGLDITAVCLGCICTDPSCSNTHTLTFQSQSRFRTDCDQYCLNTQGVYELPAKNVNFSSADISESTQLNGAVNTITLDFVLTESLGAGGEIRLSNMLFNETPPVTRLCVFGLNASALQCLNCNNNTNRYATWEASGDIIMTVAEGGVLRAGEHAQLQFRVTNPVEVNRAACTGSRICPSLIRPRISVRYAPLLALAGRRVRGDILGGGSSTVLLEASAAESNSMQNADNWIDLRFTSLLDIENGTTIQISGIFAGNLEGLVGSNGVNDSIALHGDNHTVACFTFGNMLGFGELDSKAGTLTLSTDKNCLIPSRQPIRLFFKVRNAVAEQNGMRLSMTASQTGCTRCVYKFCPCLPTDASDIQIPRTTLAENLFASTTVIQIERGSIAESNGVPGQPNSISVSLFISVPVLPQTMLVISGFQSTLSVPTHALPVRVGDAETVGTLDIFGNLTVELPRSYEAMTEIVLAFEIVNGFDPASGRFSASGYAHIDLCQRIACPAFLDSAGNMSLASLELSGEALLLDEAPQITLATIKESTRVLGAMNVITVRMRLNFQLPVGASIELHGLSNSGTPAATMLTAVSSYEKILPNCSCPTTCDTCSQVCETCTQAAKLRISQQFRLWNPEIDEAGMTVFGLPKTTDFQPDGADVVGFWHPVNNGGVLNVSVARTFPAEADLVFGFAVSNPMTAKQASRPTVSVRAGTNIFLPDSPMEGDVIGSDKPAAFTFASITEDLSVDGGVSTLRVVFESNCPLLSPQPPGMQIRIAGLNGFSTAYGEIFVFGSDRYDVAISSVAEWVATADGEGGSLVLTGGTVQGGCSSLETFEGCAQYDSGQNSSAWRKEFTFYLKRRRGPPESSTPLIGARSAGLQFDQFAMTTALASGQLPDAFMVSASISESQQLASVPNRLTVSFQVNVDLLQSSTVTLMGLLGGSTESTDDLEISGVDGHKFGFRGMWERTTGQLVLVVAAEQVVPQNEIVTFDFTITNPVARQQPASVFLAGTLSAPPRPDGAPEGSGLSIAGIDVEGEVLSASLSPGFLTRQISESTTVNGAMNTITVSISANIPLPAGAEVTISGLNSVSQPAQITVSEQHPELFGGNGTWDGGALHLVSKRQIPERDMIVFSFQLQNRQCARHCEVPVFVNATGGATARVLQLVSTKMSGSVLGASGHVAWASKVVHESSKNKNGRNNLTFALQPNAPLFAGSTIVVHGLVYSPDPDPTAAFAIVQPCFNCEGEPPVCFVGGVPTLSASEYELEQCRIGVYMRSEEGSEQLISPASVFDGIAYWDLRAGTMSFTIAQGMVLREDQRTYFSVFVRNSFSGNAKMQCDKFPTSQCLTVQAPVANLCSNVSSNIGLPCAKGELVSSTISDTTPSVDHLNYPLLDTCPTCLRPFDLVHVDDVLQQQDTLVVSELEVSVPSTRGLPTYVPGGVVPGDYIVSLDVTNWVGQHGSSSYTFSKKRGASGFTMNEIVEPLVYLDGYRDMATLVVDGDNRVEIKVLGSAALCHPGAVFEVLQFKWTMTCLGGFGDLPCNLVNYTHRDDLRALTIEPGLLPAGAFVSFEVVATQASLELDEPIRRSVQVVVGVRPPQPLISGVNPNGIVSVVDQDVVVSAADSYDPEEGLTEMKSDDFAFSWGCEYHDPVLDAFVPCLDGRGFVSHPDNPLPASSSQGISTSQSLTLNATLLSRDGTYRIAVSAYRANETVLMQRGLEVFLFGPSSIGYSSVTFTLGPAHPFSVELRLCEASDLGTPNLCQRLRERTGVNANEKTVLFADTSGVDITWNTFGNLAQHILLPENLLTNAGGSLLVLAAGVLAPGHKVKFRVTVRERQGIDEGMGFSEMELMVNVPPLAGTLTVEPAVGTALQTEFQIESQAWTVDAENLPLTFKFTVHVAGRIGTTLQLSRGFTQTLTTVLPAGDVGDDFRLGVNVEVFDTRGASSNRNTTVAVAPGDLDLADLRRSLSLLTAGDDVDTVVSGLGSIALSMQDPEACADGANGTVTVYLAAPPACKAALDERRVFRGQLVDELAAVRGSLPASADNLKSLAGVLNGIIRAPLEIDRGTTRKAHAMVRRMMATARGLRGGHGGFHHTAASTLHALLLAANAQAVPGVLPTPPPVNASSAAARRGGTTAAGLRGAGLEEAESVQEPRALGQRRASVSQDDAAMTLELLQGISEVSSLSVSDQLDGQKAVNVSTALYSMSTRRVSLRSAAGFVPSEGRSAPLEMSVPGTEARATLPGALLGVLEEVEGSGEVMLLVWHYDDGPLPQTWGPAVGIEVRRLGASTQIPVPALEVPFSIDLPLVRPISTVTNPTTGEGFTSFGSYFDPLTWTWLSDGINKVVGTETFVNVLSNHFSHFSVVEVRAGCDEQPRSGVVLDGCNICGGDNSTCSGCDGIPNTGLDRFCSGHGQCGVAACSCEANYYGNDCFNYCNNLITCSGHGFCDADFNGRRCNCVDGWAVGNIGYPGPFCAVQVGQENSTLSTPAPLVQEEDDAGQLILILVAVFSVLGVCIIGGIVYWVVARQKVAAQAVKKTIIDFSATDDPHVGEPPKRVAAPPPALLLEAAPAPAMLPAPAPRPDEHWQPDMADATATFSYGPNSGFLASAVAASMRTNMGQLAVERIDRRSRVIKNQIKGRQTIAKYTAPSGVDEDEEGAAAIEQLLPARGGADDDSRAFALVMQSSDGRWEDPFHAPTSESAGLGNGNGNGHGPKLPFHSRFEDQEFGGLASHGTEGYESGEHEESLENGVRQATVTWQVSQSPEWIQNSREAAV